ncbi:hypothetical protein [Neisseria iguanae]|uniref:Integrase catalytic domain-containing protein n=1 Tax=Neisseria iguanae TaxID=90242 RepID=A0A2P7TXX5_9NEIS|nr:hypothetical protein [Neisseria iguanae]PSJ79572.1 hypothetical protein C7N83_11395 [Neisseria iguanae]
MPTEPEELPAENPLLPLDDLFYALKPEIPKLTRSNLHRCLQYHNLFRLSALTGEKEGKKGKKQFKEYPIGYVHTDITELHCATGKYYLFVGVERSTKYACIQRHQSQTLGIAAQFVRNMQEDCAFKTTHILTDNGA